MFESPKQTENKSHMKVSEENQMLGKTKEGLSSVIDEKMGTDELDKMLQSEINKANKISANHKQKNSLSNFEENIDLVNQEI